MVCISGGLERVPNRKHKNPFKKGDVVKWEMRGKVMIGKVERAMVGIDDDNPNLVRCHVKVGSERFGVHASSLTLVQRGEGK